MDKSFTPSRAFVYLLYSNLARELPKEVHSTMVNFTQTQMQNSIAKTFEYLQDDLHDVLIVDRDCNMNPKVLNEIKKVTEKFLHLSAEFDKKEFHQRFGEEIMVWFLQNQEAAEEIGLMMKDEGVVLVSKLASHGIDNLGCA